MEVNGALRFMSLNWTLLKVLKETISHKWTLWPLAGGHFLNSELCKYLMKHGHLFFGQPLLLLFLPPAFLFLTDSATLLPPPLQLLQLLLGLSLSLLQLLHLLALLRLEAPPDLLQALLRLQDGLRLLRIHRSAETEGVECITLSFCLSNTLWCTFWTVKHFLSNFWEYFKKSIIINHELNTLQTWWIFLFCWCMM